MNEPTIDMKEAASNWKHTYNTVKVMADENAATKGSRSDPPHAPQLSPGAGAQHRII